MTPLRHPRAPRPRYAARRGRPLGVGRVLTALLLVATGLGCGTLPGTRRSPAPPRVGAFCVGASLWAAATDAERTRLAAADDHDTVAVWDLRSRKLVSRFSMDSGASPYSGASHALAFDRDGTLLASGGRDGTVRVWSVADGRLVARLPHSADSVTRGGVHFGSGFPVVAVAFDPRGRWLVSVSSNGSVFVWATRGWAPQDSLLVTDSARARPATLNDAVLADDGRTLLVASHDSVISSWGTDHWRSLGRLERVVPALDRLAVSPDGAQVAAVGQLGDLRLWDRHADLLRPTWRLPGARPRPAFFPSGRQLAVSHGPGSGVLEILELNAAGIARLGTVPLPWHANGLDLLDISPDGRHLLTGRGFSHAVYDVPMPEQLSPYFLPDRRRPSSEDCRPGTFREIDGR